MMSLPTEYTNAARDFTSRNGDVYRYGRLKNKNKNKRRKEKTTKNIQHRPSGIFLMRWVVSKIRQAVATFNETVYLNV